MSSSISCRTWQHHHNKILYHLLVNGIILWKVIVNQFVILTFPRFLLCYLFGANNGIM